MLALVTVVGLIKVNAVPSIVVLNTVPASIVAVAFVVFNETSTNNSCYADLLIHRDTIRIYNLHLESLHLGNDDYSLLKEWDEEPIKEQLQDKTHKLSNKISKASNKRVSQVEKIMESINSSPYPTLLCTCDSTSAYCRKHGPLLWHYNGFHAFASTLCPLLFGCRYA